MSYQQIFDDHMRHKTLKQKLDNEHSTIAIDRSIRLMPLDDARAILKMYVMEKMHNEK